MFNRAPFGLTAIVLIVASLSGGLSWAFKPDPARLDPAGPQLHTEGGYVSSNECRTCHPGAYDSWHRSYHRSMTRRATFLVEGRKDVPSFPVALELDGVTFDLEVFDQRVRVTGPDLQVVARELTRVQSSKDSSPSWKRDKSTAVWSNAPIVTRDIVLVTGSHHYLAFWLSGGEGKPLRQLPFVYFLDEKQWIPRREAFLQPPDAPPHVANFNGNCIQCHTVAGRPRQSQGVDDLTGAFWEHYASDAVDLGIACEACHGPGREHVAHYRSPWARLRAHLDHTPPPDRSPYSMFSPSTSSAEVSSAVCGQCHSYFVPSDPDQWWDAGFSKNFEPGDDLEASRALLHRGVSGEATLGSAEQALIAEQAHVNAEPDTMFWQDGSIMVGGREYNGLLKSPCYERGQTGRTLSCMACHSMHDGDPVDQIKPSYAGAGSNQQCSQCHQVAPGHSRHRAGSIGALCVNCHMPKTSYALLSAIRSHRVSSPAPIDQSSHQPPQACALCHTDRSAAWLNRELAHFQEPPPKQPPHHDPNDDGMPWAIEQALVGHAATRAIMLAALASPEALETAGPAPFTTVIQEALSDEYAAVAHMARRAQARLQRSTLDKQARAAVEFEEPSRARLQQLRLLRDQRPIVVSE